jgi:tetratricopeptide (TPR) repeat protein
MAQSQTKPQQDLADMLRRALALHQRGQLPEAEALYGAVLGVQPDNFDALHLYGVLQHQRGQHTQALTLIAKALRTNARSAAAHSNYASVLAALYRAEEAIASYAKAIALQPDFINAIVAQGNTLYALGRFAEALVSYERALAIKPDFAEIHNNCGNALWSMQRPLDALTHYDKALSVKPDYAEAYNNRGNALLDLNRTAEALASFDAALSRKADYSDALVNRGNALRDLNRDDEALESYRRAIALAPELAEAHWNMGLLALSRGDYELGWQCYEWRWRRNGAQARNFTQPQWRGEDLGGKTILLHAEQGFGDVIQFLRYVPMAAARGAKIILEIPDALRPLVSGTDGVTAIRSRNDPLPAFDLHSPLMSLPLGFGTTLDTIPPPAHLRTPAERLEKWCARLPRGDKPRIGLTWSGKPTHRNDHNRSIGFSRLAPLFSPPGFEFVSLQRENRDSDLPALPQFPRLIRLEDELADFADTAAVIDSLDLVIAVDTAVAHLAGSLGKPVWIMLPFGGDWRWLLDGDVTPWYPDARLFRQPELGDWDSVVARLVGELLNR